MRRSPSKHTHYQHDEDVIVDADDTQWWQDPDTQWWWWSDDDGENWYDATKGFKGAEQVHYTRGSKDAYGDLRNKSALWPVESSYQRRTRDRQSTVRPIVQAINMYKDEVTMLREQHDQAMHMLTQTCCRRNR